MRENMKPGTDDLAAIDADPVLRRMLLPQKYRLAQMRRTLRDIERRAGPTGSEPDRIASEWRRAGEILEERLKALAGMGVGFGRIEVEQHEFWAEIRIDGAVDTRFSVPLETCRVHVAMGPAYVDPQRDMSRQGDAG